MHAATLITTLHTRNGRTRYVPAHILTHIWRANLTQAQERHERHMSATLRAVVAPVAHAITTRATLDTRPCEQDTRPALITLTTRRTLTREQRNITRALRDYSARMRCALRLAREPQTARVNRHAARYAALMPGWRGLTPALDTRHSERGASGIAGVKGAAAHVSQRDAHAPTMLLRAMPAGIVVGHATDTRLTREQRAWLLDTLRRDPQRATLTRLMPGPHGLMRTVRPVSDYVALRQERRDATRAARATRIARESDVMRLASRDASTVIGAQDTL